MYDQIHIHITKNDMCVNGVYMSFLVVFVMFNHFISGVYVSHLSAHNMHSHPSKH